MSSPRLRQTPGQVYQRDLRCEYCDYVLVVRHSGPNYERGRWELKVCPNCKAKGIKSFLVRSLK
jgi:uncharacterized protein CbrC (UPF0167 family)